MRKILAAVVATVALLIVSPACAADLGAAPYDSTKDLAPNVTWAGFSAAVYGGGTFFDGDVHGTWKDRDWDSVSFSGFTLGAEAAYRWQAGFLVFGPYGGLSYATTSSHDTHATWRGEAGLLAGIGVGPSLWYGKVGYVQTHLHEDRLDDFSEDLHGVQLGGGVEYRFGPRWSAFGEVDVNLYSDVGIPEETADIRSSDVGFRAGLRYRF